MNDVTQKLDALWAEFEGNYPLLKRGYCFHEIQERPILFMGINPSMDETKPDSFSYTLPDTFNKATVSKYFEHYYDYAESVGVKRSDWTYQDVFFYRHTTQETAPEHSDKSWLDFLVAHLQITQSIIEEIQPRLIVVCNAEASKHYFGVNANPERTQWVFMGYKFIFDETLGCHKITGCRPALGEDYHVDTQLVGTYVLFTSYLPYRSTADKKTLEWHLRHIWKKIKLQ